MHISKIPLFNCFYNLVMLSCENRLQYCVPAQVGGTEQYKPNTFGFKDVRAHCYCASLVRTLSMYMTWRVPHHVFQAHTPSRNSTKYMIT